MKKLIILLPLLLLGACDPLPNQFDQEDYSKSAYLFSTICLDGVEYWIRAAPNKSYLAVRIDPETLQPRRCTR